MFFFSFTIKKQKNYNFYLTLISNWWLIKPAFFKSWICPKVFVLFVETMMMHHLNANKTIQEPKLPTLTLCALGLILFNRSTNSTANVKCYVTYVTRLPTGREEGQFLALDLGGTNFRVILAELHTGSRSVRMKCHKHEVSIMIILSQPHYSQTWGTSCKNKQVFCF